jgi:hypothetical protein
MSITTESFAEEAAVRGYLHLMHELAIRVDLVARACNGDLNLSPPYAREYCYLQGACSCMVTFRRQGPMRQKRNGMPERIMKLLERNHPHSFPQSLTRTKTANGWQLEANSKPNALTFIDFKALYNKCGEILHRGTIRTIETEEPIAKSDYDEVIHWSHKVVDLLNEHVVARANSKGLYHISLKTESGGPACSVYSGFSGGTVSVATYNLEVHEDY